MYRTPFGVSLLTTSTCENGLNRLAGNCSRDNQRIRLDYQVEMRSAYCFDQLAGHATESGRSSQLAPQ